ncbi:uncharacterized protein BKA55DRAFT_688989 [Fusarium redolens]|uniref:Uncharacterized protein n=1 Tax=Fusarium redolens TaxID=48865 RepID=A0A9P9H9H7_FUSRE|nr:uncharacterized protein BKA55DRAFT_688989 [Fusarium redolens]KAH7253495.1 hypothetical protein BKA55DRAFT_688989 [Fusarium redolens]
MERSTFLEPESVKEELIASYYAYIIEHVSCTEADTFTLSSMTGERLTKVKTFSDWCCLCIIEFQTNKSRKFLPPSDFWYPGYYTSPNAVPLPDVI